LRFQGFDGSSIQDFEVSRFQVIKFLKFKGFDDFRNQGFDVSSNQGFKISSLLGSVKEKCIGRTVRFVWNVYHPVLVNFAIQRAETLQEPFMIIILQEQGKLSEIPDKNGGSHKF
jgi:hypothetical protein